MEHSIRYRIYRKPTADGHIGLTFYVGGTDNPDLSVRFKGHYNVAMSKVREGTKNVRHLAIHELGQRFFDEYDIEDISDHIATEKQGISYYNTFYKNGHGWNMNTTGWGCRPEHSAEARRKMSAAHKGDRNGMFGKTHSEESRRKNSESHKSEKNGRWIDIPDEDILATIESHPDWSMAKVGRHLGHTGNRPDAFIWYRLERLNNG